MRREFETIIKHLIGADNNSLVKINISSQFDPEDIIEETVLRNLNSAFLIELSGESHPLYEEAKQYLRILQDREDLKEILDFLRCGQDIIAAEIEELCSSDEGFRKRLDRLYEFLEADEKSSGRMEIIEYIREVFFPEGLNINRNRDEKITELQKKRKVDISQLNPDPVKNPEKEILFTSNILITTPARSKDIAELPLSGSLRKRIEEAAKEDQLYWYDHPVQIGVETDRNEAIYGLRGLDEAVRFEQERGTVPKDARLDCVLSVSTTHKALQTLTKDYLEEEFKRDKSIQHLNIYLFSEKDTRRLIDDILIPATKHYLQNADANLIYEIIGVDGEYGRHYSFLKAIAAFWNVLIDPDIKGTFKVDLDQIFPQKELVEQTGKSAFQHFTTPLWGAEGTDASGEEIELGMIAGALVNEHDIRKSLFTPDVPFPHEEIKGDELIFYSLLPQALSTEAEMMTRYTDNTYDGRDQCIQRIHVTGGTCGILVDCLRKYRPFTPTFIGRAEDQAYILSVLFKDPGRNLRYVHKDGLIMRHDKETFAKEAIKTAYPGKLVGDYARILWFSHYVRLLPWPCHKTKELIDPFTGCFISHMPFTIIYLRLTLKAASFFASEDDEKKMQGMELLRMGSSRLLRIIMELNQETNPLIERYSREKEGWDIYYDILDHLEKDLETGDAFAVELRYKAKKIVADCKLNT